MPWSARFDDPIPLPRGRQLVTLQDAGTYITRLPKAEHEATEWQAAMEALILVATLGGPTMMARIGVMRALNRHVVREFNPNHKETRWGRPETGEGSMTGTTARDLKIEKPRPDFWGQRGPDGARREITQLTQHESVK